MSNTSCTYILANRKNGTLYVGVTSNLVKRIFEHKNNVADGFTKKYQIHNLVHYESFGRIEDAICREKQLKNWRRSWKTKLIEETNPKWNDLYSEIL